jgi:polygalacturonase
MERRDLLRLSPLVLGTALPGAPLHGAALPAEDRRFDVTSFGAAGDGKTLNTRNIQRAIDAAAARGGGRVNLPPGKFLCGGLVLRSNVTFFLEPGSTLLGSTHFSDYEPQSGPSDEGDANAHHLLFARGAENVTVTGGGTIDGQGQSYWTSAGRPPTPPENMWKDVIAFDWKATPRRPSPMLEFVTCTNLRLEGITIRNAPGWTLRPVDCETVYLRGLTIRNPNYGPNTDGLDITASRNVFVSDCDISCGDDAICIKSENPYGETRATANITITNCVLTTCCNGFKIGTSTHGVIENIVFSNSVIYNNDGPLNERVIAGLAIEMVDGGTLDGVLVSNIRMRNTRTPIFIRLATRRPGNGTSLRNVRVCGIDATGAVYASSITGVPGHAVEDITLENIRISSAEQGLAAWSANTVPELEQQYPEARMFGRLPAYGLYVRHARRIRLRDLELVTEKMDGRSAIVTDDVDDLLLSGLLASSAPGVEAVVALHDTRRALLQSCRAPAQTACFVSVTGAKSQEIVLLANDLSGAAQAVRQSHEVGENAVRGQAQ